MNVPKLRFKEFDGEWEERKLEESVSNIGTGKSEFKINLKSAENKFAILGSTSIIGFDATYDYEGEFILTARVGANAGNLYRYNGKVKISDNTVYIQGTNLSFVYALLNKFNLKKLSFGTGQPLIKASELKKLSLFYPNAKEQNKIGYFLELLNKKIRLQQQKIDLLQEQKKGYMQKIFKQEWRFKEFTQQWKTTTIGSLAEISRGASPRPIQDPKWFDGNSNVGWLRISDVTKQNGRIHYLEQKISILGQEKTRVLETPHLLLSIAATVGKPVINYIPTGVHDGFLIFYNPTFNVEFMFQWLEMFRDNWQKYGQPGSQVNLNSELVKNQEISIPVIEEQQKIAEFLTLMDKKIQLQKEKLELLKKQKQGFMQQMFI